jgi:hypothetical protein
MPYHVLVPFRAAIVILAATLVAGLQAAAAGTEVEVNIGVRTVTTVNLRAMSYSATVTFEVISRPLWIDVEPWSGVIGSRGTSLLFRVDRKYLEPGRNRGQVVILASDGNKIIYNVAARTPDFGDFLLSVVGTVGLVYLAVVLYLTYIGEL